MGFPAEAGRRSFAKWSTKISLRERKAAVLPHLDERQRHLFAAAEAKAAGHGGIAAVARVTRIAASTIGRGLKDLEARQTLPQGRVRRVGGGRKSLTETDARLLDDLNALGSCPHRWCSRSGASRSRRALFIAP